jgi:hypothetical protein
MAEEVEIIGVDGGPASEATLKKLLEETKKASNSGSVKNVQRAYNDALKNGVKVTKDFSKKTEEATKQVEALGDVVPGFIKTIGSLMSAAGAAAGLVKNFSTELMFGGRNIEDFAQHIPAIGEAAKDFMGMFTQNTETLRQSADIGAAFGNDIMGMSRAAANAQMPLEEFSSMVANNTDTLRQLGSTSTNGALRLSQLTKSVRLGDEQLMNLAFSTEELNEGTASYIRLQARSGRLQSMSDQELIAGTQSYLKEVDLLAKITGKSRKATQDDMEKTAAEANVLVMMQDMNDKEKKNFLGNITMVDELLGQDMGNAFKDLADGVAQTDLAKKLESLNSPLGDLAREARSGQISQAEFADRLKTVGPELLDFAKSMGGAGTSALMGQAGFSEALGSLAQVTANAGRVGNAADALAEQMQGDKFSQSMLGFNQSIDTARANLQLAFLDSATFDKTKEAMALVVDGVGDFTNAVSDGAVSVLGDFDDLLTKVVNSKFFRKLLGEDVGGLVTNKSNPNQINPDTNQPRSQDSVLAENPVARLTASKEEQDKANAARDARDAQQQQKFARSTQNTQEKEAMAAQKASPNANKSVNTSTSNDSQAQLASMQESNELTKKVLAELTRLRKSGAIT